MLLATETGVRGGFAALASRCVNLPTLPEKMPREVLVTATAGHHFTASWTPRPRWSAVARTGALVLPWGTRSGGSPKGLPLESPCDPASPLPGLSPREMKIHVHTRVHPRAHTEVHNNQKLEQPNVHQQTVDTHTHVSIHTWNITWPRNGVRP